MVKRKILVITDDASVCYSIKECMENDNTDVFCTSSPTEALDRLMKQKCCLVIIDFQLPGLNGLEMLRIMRDAEHTPILVIAPHLSLNGKVALFQAGANAYIEKPVDMNICNAQSAMLMGMYKDVDDNSKKGYPLIFGSELIISPLYRQVIIDGTQLELTRTEFDLLYCLAQHPGQVWSRSQLYQYVWADTLGLEGDRTVKTHIGNLKKKLANLGKNYIRASRGVGYKFIPPDSE